MIAKKFLQHSKITQQIYYYGTQHLVQRSQRYSYEQEKIHNIANLIAKYKLNSVDDFKAMQQEVYRISDRVTPVNVDTIVLSNCITVKRFDLGFKYVELMREQKQKFNIAAMGKLFKMYYHLYSKDGVIDDEKAEEILKLYNNLKSEYSLLDAITSEAVISALSLTKHWSICLDILEEIKIAAVPSLSSYSNTISAAFYNKEDAKGLSLLEDMIAVNKPPLDESYMAYIDNIDFTNKDGASAKLDVLLEFLGNNDIVCSENLVNAVKIAFNKIGKESHIITISSSGGCSSCKTKLPMMELSREEFESLKSQFFEKVIVGKDVFRKTTPEELNNFKKFIAGKRKYDVIIDGLNVGYSKGVRTPYAVQSHLVASVVKHFAYQKKSILVLGRTHMNKWPRHNLQFIQKNAELFLTNNLSQDDPYLLYCALNSNMNTTIVTRDLMRSHLYLLKDVTHKRLFTRWLSQSQHVLIRVTDNGRVILQAPLPYVRTTQKVQNKWHLPITTENQLNNNKWLCVK